MIRYCLVLAVLLLLPIRTGSLDDDEDDEPSENADEGDDEEKDDDDEDTTPEKVNHVAGRRAPLMLLSTPQTLIVTRTTNKRPLECYVCAFKPETPIRACLDPTKFRVHTITCNSSEDKCFTMVISNSSNYEGVLRGCRSGCISSSETTCCERNRCNSQAFAMPEVRQPRTLTSEADVIQPTVLFFVTILLVLQTVVKVPSV